MQASSSRSRVRPIVVEFLATLFVTFCIGVVTAVVLAACVMLMAGEAHGEAQAGELAPMKASEAWREEELRESAPAEEMRARLIELALTHHLVTKYASLIAIDRTPVRPEEQVPQRTRLQLLRRRAG